MTTRNWQALFQSGDDISPAMIALLLSLEADVAAGGGGAASDATVTFTDITTNNASTSKHGFLRKLDNNVAHFLDGTGAWSTPTPPELVRVVAAAYAATVTPNADTTDVLNVGALTGNITIANPTGTPVDGQNLLLRLTQDGTGSRTMSFGANFAFGTDVTAAMIPTAASSKWELLFTWNATDSKWRATGITRGF